MNTEINVIDVKMKHPRVEYFAGQFLEAKDFQAEQEYHLMRRRQLNQELFSHGVRRGFAVAAEGPDQKTLRVGSGAAMDVLGRELWLAEDQVLEFPTPVDGEYCLRMQLQEKPDEWRTYSQEKKSSAASAESGTSPWQGNTRNTETIEFSMVGAAHENGPAYIKLARMQCKDGRFTSIDFTGRHISTASLRSGLAIHPSGHYIDMYYEGKLNAYIGADLKRQGPECVTFCSTSRRMHLSGEEDLYLLHQKGVVIAKSWYGDIAESGSLTVQGATTLDGSLTVRGATTLVGSLTAQGATTLQGGLNITRKSDAADGGKLTVQGAATLQGGLNVVRDVVIEKDPNEKTPGRNGGNLMVHGMATVVEGLNVRQYAVVEGSLQVTEDINVNVLSDAKKRRMLIKGGALKDQALSIAGAEFTYNPDASNPGMKLFAQERMHISGDEELYLLHKKGVVIGKHWYPDSTKFPQSGTLDVHGKATVNELMVREQSSFKGLVVHSPGERSMQSMDSTFESLKNDGDFFFFVEEPRGDAMGLFWVHWRTKGRVLRRRLVTE